MKGKKIIRIILAIFLCTTVIVSSTSCDFSVKGGSASSSNTGTKTSNRITLTTSNCNYYLSVSARCYGDHLDTSNYAYKSVTSSVSVEGASSRYEYIYVVVTIEVRGTAYLKKGGTKSFTHTIKCTLNASGRGGGTKTDSVLDLTRYSSMNLYATKVVCNTVRIVDISGYVEPIG